ncbi:MAG: hypothetical protein OXC13_15475 [Caldilineaceae bacterium]|nr:hypothetical protein [Caldilineaceae bacterium]
MTTVIGGVDTWVEVEEFGRVTVPGSRSGCRDCTTCWGRVMALDSQTARRSHDRIHGRSALHTVSTYACKSRLVLESTAVEAPSHELTALPKVLVLLDLAGTTVILDAIGCWKNPAQHLRAQ